MFIFSDTKTQFNPTLNGLAWLILSVCPDKVLPETSLIVTDITIAYYILFNNCIQIRNIAALAFNVSNTVSNNKSIL